MRASRRGDGAALFDVWYRAIVGSHDFLKPDDLATIVEMVQRDYFPSTQFTVAVDDADRPVGFIEVDGDSIGALFVDPDMQGRGVARALIAATMPTDRAWTVEVNEANSRARRFYEQLGCVLVGRRETDDLGLHYPLLRLEHSAAAV
nr:GNAT family N-acetyltransferase [Sphingomonas japonica]